MDRDFDCCSELEAAASSYASDDELAASLRVMIAEQAALLARRHRAYQIARTEYDEAASRLSSLRFDLANAIDCASRAARDAGVPD